MKIALDIDGVLACFSSGIIAEAYNRGISHAFPASAEEVSSWDMCDLFYPLFNEVKDIPEFWLNLPRLPHVPNFVPRIYLTSRPIDSKVTKAWLEKHKLPKAKVVTVDHPSHKLEILHKHNVEVLVDDYYKTVHQVNESRSGVRALLFEAPYQKGHEDEIAHLPKINTLEYNSIREAYLKLID